MINLKKVNASFFIFSSLSLIMGFVIFAILTKTLPLFASKTLYFCQQFLTNTMFEIPHSLPNIVVFALVAILTVGIISFLVQLKKTHDLMSKLLVNKVRPPRSIEKIVYSLNLENKVTIIRENNLFSFCSGIFSPKVVITTGLLDLLSDKELEAVLLHEKAHLASKDPLKILLGKTISSMFFFLPIFSELHKNVIATSELLADRFTIENQKGNQGLKMALRKILSTPQVNLNAFPAIANQNYLEIRIRRLKNPATKISFYISPFSLITTFAFLGINWFIMQTPVEAFQKDEMNNHPSTFVCAITDSCHHQCKEDAGYFDQESFINMSTSPSLKFKSLP